MKKCRLLLIASLPLAVAIIVGVLALLPPRPGVTTANFDRIRKGMTEDEVRGILGEKGFELRRSSANNENCKKKMRWLVNDWICADIQFVGGLVVEKSWAGNDENPTILDEIRRWIHLD
jgi:hypothetical protein